MIDQYLASARYAIILIMRFFQSKFLLVALLALGLTACEDLATFNENPNAPTIDQASPNLILPKILYEVGNEMTADLGWGFSNIVSQLVATNNFTSVDIYAWGTYSGTWDLMYRNARDAQNLIILGENLGNDNYVAIGMTMKAYIFSVLTDMYGDIPYSEALQGKSDANFTPVYDNQQAIYTDLLDQLEQASNLFDVTQSIDGDIMFSGDVVKWAKFTNSLRFRMIMRLENKWSEMGLSSTDLQAIVDKGVWMESNDDSAMLPYLSVGANRWPLHTSRIGSFEEKRMSQTIEAQLNATADPRLEVYFRPVANPDSTGVYRGIPNGLSEDNAINFNGGPKNQSTLGTRFREEPDAVDMVFMHYSEFLFLLAEAAEKGYITGDAEAFYVEGIAANMEYYGLAPDASFYDQEGVAMSMAGTSADRLELIGTQKWLSLFMVGMEPYFDIRRTGIPALTPGQDALFNEVPVRIQYPSSEQALNIDNYDAVVARQGADEITTMMWLLQ